MNLGIIFKCGEAAHVCDKSQYRESSLFERMLMKMHHLMCRICRKHSSENGKLSEAINKSNVKVLSEKDKSVLKEKIQQEISK